MRPSRATVVCLIALVGLTAVLFIGFRGGLGGLEKCGADNAALCVPAPAYAAYGVWLLFLAGVALPLWLQAREWIGSKDTQP